MIARPVLTALCGLVLLATAAVAAPVAVNNGATPADGVQTVALNEVWRAGGDDDDIFFGTLGAVRTDTEGNILILDSQLAEIQVYAPDGEHLRTLGREGDGPGEMRNPSDMFITSDGVIYGVMAMPGRIVGLSSDGMPAGETTYKAAPGQAGQFGVLIAGRASGTDMVLAGIRMVFEGGVNKQTYFLANCDSDGAQKTALLEKEHAVNMADFVMDEMDMDFIWGRFAVGDDGRVYAAPDRNAYLINVYAPDGTLERTITREYDAPQRTERQKKLAHQVIAAVGANYPRPPREITTEDIEAVVGAMTVMENGDLWVQTSRGNLGGNDGAFVVFDVFDAEGKFARQVALQGDHDPARDAINLLPGGRVVVISGALDAWLNQQGATAEAEEAQEGEPLEVICYEMGS